MSEKKYTIGFLDDHSLILDGIRNLFQKYSGITAIFFSTSDSLFSYLEEDFLNLLVSDLGMPEKDWYFLLKTLKNKYPDLPIVVLSQYDSTSIVSKVLKLGVSGYILKSEPSQLIPDILLKILKGEKYYSKEILKVKQHFHSYNVSDFEEEILELVSKGFTMQEVASHLQTSPKAIEYRLKKLREFFGVKNTAELISEYHQSDL